MQLIYFILHLGDEMKWLIQWVLGKREERESIYLEINEILLYVLSSYIQTIYSLLFHNCTNKHCNIHSREINTWEFAPD